MLRNKADRATRALLREISRDNVDLFSSFESTRSVPTRASSVDSSALGIISPALKLLQFTYFGGFFFTDKSMEKAEKMDSTPEKPPVKKEISPSEKTLKTERPVANKPLKPKQECENKPAKKADRPEKSSAERLDAKSSSRSASSGADTAAKSNSKKGRQTNNSLSSVIDSSSLGHLENGGVKYRRVTAA